jgi:hypothetical protein
MTDRQGPHVSGTKHVRHGLDAVCWHCGPGGKGMCARELGRWVGPVVSAQKNLIYFF